MQLTNAQYDSILNEYKRRQNYSRKILDQRTAEIYKNIPEYEEFDHKIAALSISEAKQRLQNGGAESENYKEQLEDLKTQKKLLLTRSGYSINYLDPIYMCPYCKDTGFIENEKCHCFKQAMLDLLYEQSNIRQMLAEQTFDNISFEYQQGENLDRLRAAVSFCEDFVDKFDVKYQNLLLCGNVGTGKSFLSGCVANELLNKGHSVIYFSAVGLFEKISEYVFQKNDKDASSNPFDDIYSCDLLIIDDLGTELVNNFVMTQLFSIINERHLRHKATVISTNLELGDLKSVYSERITSRLFSLYNVFKLSGTDVRLIQKRMENRK